jgi:hypothetical protein
MVPIWRTASTSVLELSRATRPTSVRMRAMRSAECMLAKKARGMP